eukprot:TRINITY_DN75785_c0_g1_i1.p1 TRINITY_DN75785_c0_g1~~TRINITY_DN75785_c0_g1_i1.p1  ORF type:complete len:217 (+),score=35.09 TRINITY_DN75785_c0_g1_i1:103-753(+)
MQLVKNLSATHGTFKTVAMVCHGACAPADLPLPEDEAPPKWFLTCDHGVDFERAESDPTVDDCFQAVADATSVRVDLLACSFAETTQGKEWLAKWEKKTRINFAASTNCTGNPEVDGDWVLETDGIDACNVYFNVDKLMKWQVALGKGKYKCEVPLFGGGCKNMTNYENRICGRCKKDGWRPYQDCKDRVYQPNGEQKVPTWRNNLANEIRFARWE